jgi:hypothetical protein
MCLWGNVLRGTSVGTEKERERERGRDPTGSGNVVYRENSPLTSRSIRILRSITRVFSFLARSCGRFPQNVAPSCVVAYQWNPLDVSCFEALNSLRREHRRKVSRLLVNAPLQNWSRPPPFRFIHFTYRISLERALECAFVSLYVSYARIQVSIILEAAASVRFAFGSSREKSRESRYDTALALNFSPLRANSSVAESKRRICRDARRGSASRARTDEDNEACVNGGANDRHCARVTVKRTRTYARRCARVHQD